MLAEAHQVADSVHDSDPIAVLITEGRYRDAVALCASEHGVTLGRLCMALLGSQTDAEEVVQETLIAAHGAMASYRGEGRIRSWLCGIARRQCARFVEKRGRQARPLRLVAPDEVAGPASKVAAWQRATAVRAALAELKPSVREALVLRYESELSYREIGAICGIDEAAARKRASRGLKHLRTILTPEVVE